MGNRIFLSSKKPQARANFKKLLMWNNRPKAEKMVTSQDINVYSIPVASLVSDETKVGIRIYNISVRNTVDNSFLSGHCTQAIYFYKDTKKLWTMNHRAVVSIVLRNPQLLKILGLEWTKELPDYLFIKNTIKAILQGRCTNRDEVVRRYFSYKGIKGMNYKRFALFKDEFSERKYESYYKVATNLENLVNYKKNTLLNYDINIIDDLVNMSLQLGRKINFNWSPRRMEEEHDKLVKEIVQIKLKYQEHKEVDYSGFEVPVTKEVTILKSNSDLLQESCELSHCVGTSGSYFNSMVNLDYVIIRYKNGKSRGTAQIRIIPYEEGVYRISQFKGRFNASMPVKDVEFLEQTLKKDDFNKFLEELRANRSKIQKNITLEEVDEYDLPF